MELDQLKERHNYLSKRVAKMERERERTRVQEHKDELKNLKKEKLRIKDKIADWDISDSGIDFYA